MKRIFYSADVIIPDGSDTSSDGDGCEPGTGYTHQHGWVSPDRSMTRVFEDRSQVVPDVFEPNEFDDEDDLDPAAWLAATLGHWERLYVVETDDVDPGRDSVTFHGRHIHDVPDGNPRGDVKVTLRAHVEGFAEDEINRALYLLARKGYPRLSELEYVRDFVRHCSEVPAGTPYCVVILRDQSAPGGYVPSVAYQGVKGHFPLMGGPDGGPWVWGPGYTQAKRTAQEFNTLLGLTPEQATGIVLSSMPL